MIHCRQFGAADMHSAIGSLLAMLSQVMLPHRGRRTPANVLLVLNSNTAYVFARRQVSSMYLMYYLYAPMCAGTTKRGWILLGIWTWLAFLILRSACVPDHHQFPTPAVVWMLSG